MSFLNASVRAWLQLANLIEGILGLGFLGFGSYLIYEDQVLFYYLVAGLGLFTVLLSLLGCQVIGSRSKCGVSTYNIGLSLLFLIHATFVTLCLWKKDTLIWWVKKESDHDKRTEKYQKKIEDNLQIVGWVALGILILEFISLFISVCLKHRVVLSEKEEYEREREKTFKKGQRKERKRDNSGTEPLLDPASSSDNSQRSRMNAKYGGIFAGSSRSSKSRGVDWEGTDEGV